MTPMKESILDLMHIFDSCETVDKTVVLLFVGLEFLFLYTVISLL